MTRIAVIVVAGTACQQVYRKYKQHSCRNALHINIFTEQHYLFKLLKVIKSKLIPPAIVKNYLPDFIKFSIAAFIMFIQSILCRL